MILTIFTVLAFSVLLIVFYYKSKTKQELFISNFIYYALLFISAMVLMSQFAGSDWPATIQVSAFVFIMVFWQWQTLKSSFWGVVFFQACFMAHLFIGGYLYSATQIPYVDEPFREISNNQPHELEPGNFPHHWVTGLPRESYNSELDYAAVDASHNDVSTQLNEATQQQSHADWAAALRWEKLAPLMRKDSQIRTVLQNLKEAQQRELSDMLARLNADSVASTRMRRKALSRRQIQNLLNERAISQSYFRTINETWRLLDVDERNFRQRQYEDRFHVLLELMEDEKIDESHRVEFIDFMVAHFAGDVRLIKPLISLYDHLDEAYPRQKRQNKAFLDLYVARCKALLNGFARIGEPVMQPLLDYRRRTVSEIHYSQARLDKFIEQQFGVKPPVLYQPAEPQSIADFLNRRKYPIAEKLTGASFKQDYIRRNLMQMMIKNIPPKFDQPVMNASEQLFQQIKSHFERAGFDDAVDYLLVDADPAVRGNLAWYLAERKDPYLVPLVFELMRDPNPEVRRMAAIAAGNFVIRDTQGASDPKFIEIVKMLQNYRSNSDAFGRAWALFSLSNIADQQKALYIVDLILNDGEGYHSGLGAAAPTWRSEEERHVVHSLIETLSKTPEELLVKTYALNTLIALNSPESLGILLQYLHHIYDKHHTRPSMWRYFMPHMTLPQEAENVEDVVVYFAKVNEGSSQETHTRHLKAINEFLRKAYEADRSGEYFQILRFLKVYNPSDYESYLLENDEQIRIMRIWEYLTATHLFWILAWPFCLVGMLIIIYIVFPFLNLSAPKRAQKPNDRSNPAADFRKQKMTPASTIVPVKIVNKK